MKYLEYLALRFLTFIIQISPFWLIYRLSDLMVILLHRVIRYRYNVIEDNIIQSFPEKSKKEIQTIIKAFYRNLCDVVLETFKGMTMPKKVLMDRYRFTNPEILDDLFNANIPVLMLGGHVTNWEWGVLSAHIWPKHEGIGIYKPLKNKYTDAFFKKTRGQWGLELASMRETREALEKQRKVPGAFYFIADQTPSNLKTAHWVSFFNRETAFLSGVDRIARATGLPVYYFDIRRIGRGRYELDFDVICLKPKETQEGGISQLFASRLEQSIRRDPPAWLWSHKRWKHSKQLTMSDEQ